MKHETQFIIFGLPFSRALLRLRMLRDKIEQSTVVSV